MVRRPSYEWQRRVEEQAAELAQGSLSPEEAFASHLWPESLRVSTDVALAAFEDELHTLRPQADVEVLDVVKRVVLALNKINDQHVGAGQIGYETGEREQLCDYINASLKESGVDLEALEARNGIDPGEIAGRWRNW